MTGPKKRYRIQVSVKKVTHGVCPNAMKPGKSWIVDAKTPGGICMGAFSTLLPYIRALSFGGTFYFQEEPDVAEFSCPDHVRHVIFEIRRLREGETQGD